jgi:hypothetical protein
MTDKWAYATYGALRNDDVWDFFGPRQHPGTEGHLYAAVRKNNRALFEANNTISAIGFDGHEWYVGHMALPAAVLDPTQYDRYLYSYDTARRPTYWLHGYVSESSALPMKIPLVDREHFHDLHLKHAVPLWNISISEGKSTFASKRQHKTITSFGPVERMVSLSDQLPKEACAALKEAHTAGRPIAIQFDSVAKTWAPLDIFQRSIKDLKQLRERAMEVGLPTATQTLPQEQVAEQKVTRGLLDRLLKMPLRAKLAIVGGTAALGAVIAYCSYAARVQRDASDEAAQRK